MGKTRGQDTRDYDTTQLHERQHGRILHRDYSAHFFRWNFARNFIKGGTKLLEVGCGQEMPLFNIVTAFGPGVKLQRYVGVDLNPIKKKPTRSTFDCQVFDNFNFVEQYKKLPKDNDYIVHFEVIEHMQPKHGLAMLKACRELLKPGGTMLLSTPVFNGKQAENHIHEYEIDELRKVIEKAGFKVQQRFGTFMNTNQFKKMSKEHQALAKEFGAYYDNDAMACFFAPLYPDLARNNLWVCA